MSMDEYGIRGTATTYKGNIVKYIRVFEWATGTVKEIIRPSLIGGAWEYNPLLNIDVGLTYISDDEQPYTNGPYTATGKYGDTPMEGFLLIAYRFNTPNPAYDVTATTEPSWKQRFEATADIGLFNYTHNSTSVPLKSKDINVFSEKWVMNVVGSNGATGGDKHMWTLEILTADDEVICAIKSDYGKTYSSYLYYGKNLSNLTRATTSGSYPGTGGTITFTEDSLVYTNTRTSNMNNSFIFKFDVSQAKKIRVAGSANSNSYNAGGYILLVLPE